MTRLSLLLRAHYLLVGAVTLIACVSLLLQSPSFFFIIVTLHLTYRLLVPYLSNRIFSSLLLTYLFTSFVYVILLECASLGLWIIDKNFPLSFAPYVAFLLVGVSLFISRDRASLKKRPFIQKGDVLSLTIALILTSIVVVPPFIHNGATTQNAVIDLVNGNVDDGSHLALLNDRLQFDRGIIFETGDEGSTRSGGFYPAGWHSVNALLIKAVNPTVQVGSDSLIAYTIAKVFWFTFLIFFIARASFMLYGSITHKKIQNTTYAWLSVGIALFVYFLTLDVFHYGFFNFIAQLLSAILSLFALTQLSEASSNKQLLAGGTFATFVLCLGGGISWLLVLPAFFFVWLISLVVTWKRQPSTFISHAKELFLPFILLYAIAVMALLSQVIAILTDHSSGSVSFLQGILLNGGIPTYKQEFYLLLLIGLSLCIGLYTKRSTKQITYYLYLLVPILLFAGVIYTLQVAQTDQTHYYYQKVLNIFLIAAIPMCVAGFALLGDWLKTHKSPTLATMSGILIFFVVLQFVGLNPSINASTLQYAKGKRPLTTPLASSVYTEIAKHTGSADYQQKSYVFYFQPSSFESNDIGTILAKSTQMKTPCFDHARAILSPAAHFTAAIASRIQHFCDNSYHLTIITDQPRKTHYEAVVAEGGAQSLISITSL